MDKSSSLLIESFGIPILEEIITPNNSNPIKMITSIILSVTIVPKLFSKGIFS